MEEYYYRFTRKEKQNKVNEKTKRIVLEHTSKDYAVRSFTKELNNVPDNIFFVNEYDKTYYVHELKKIPNYEELNMKLMVYCFLIARTFNFDIAAMTRELIVDGAEKIFGLFEANKDGDTFNKFCLDILINILLIFKYQELTSEDLDDRDEESYFVEGEEEKREELEADMDDF